MKQIQLLPDWMYHAIEESFTCQFVSMTASGTPVALPLFLSHFDPETGTLIVSSPTVVKRLENVRRHPEVAMLFSPTGSRQGEPPHVLLVQGRAEVDDTDPENGWKRYFAGWARRQSSARESLPKMSQMRPAYVQRAIIRVQPTRFLGWPEGDMRRAPEIVEVTAIIERQPALQATLRRLPLRGQASERNVAIDWTDELITQIGSCNRAALSYSGQDGYPVALPLPFTFNRREHLFTFPEPSQPPAISAETQASSLTLLCYNPQGANETYLLFYGQLAEDDGTWSFTPTRVVLQQWASRRGR